MTTQDHKRILAVIPCYNEAASIRAVVEKAKRYVDEVVVVNDGSKDDTSTMAQNAGASVLIHRQNRGKTAAIKTGFKYALEHDFDYVITIDGDGQHNPDEIPNVLHNVVDNGHDISIGYRVGASTEMPLYRKVGKRVLDYATSYGGGGIVTDSQCGFRAFNKRAVETLYTHMDSASFSAESEQLIKANRLGLQVGAEQVSCKYKDLDTSTKTPTSHGMSVLSYIIWMVAQRRPLLFIGVPGFLVFLSGLILGIYTLQYYNQNHVFLIPYAIVIAILMIIGAIALFMGVLLNVLPRVIKQAQQDSTEDVFVLKKEK
ncbi:MAG: glycosyltransferase family 2 protein [Candidatus Thermoplasmatota archaeon]|nr:glycosyltransferase family 2 protein [Candidatus Thermoplasmatota archaeon]